MSMRTPSGRAGRRFEDSGADAGRRAWEVSEDGVVRGCSSRGEIEARRDASVLPLPSDPSEAHAVG